jgi:hypothetical protein
VLHQLMDVMKCNYVSDLLPELRWTVANQEERG